MREYPFIIAASIALAGAIGSVGCDNGASDGFCAGFPEDPYIRCVLETYGPSLDEVSPDRESTSPVVRPFSMKYEADGLHIRYFLMDSKETYSTLTEPPQVWWPTDWLSNDSSQGWPPELLLQDHLVLDLGSVPTPAEPVFHVIASHENRTLSGISAGQFASPRDASAGEIVVTLHEPVGDHWYGLADVVINAVEYRTTYEDGPGTITGEATTFYTLAPCDHDYCDSVFAPQMRAVPKLTSEELASCGLDDSCLDMNCECHDE